MTKKLGQPQTLSSEFDQIFDIDKPYQLNMTKKYIILMTKTNI